MEGIDVKEDTEREDAIIVIQKHFRGCAARNKVEQMRDNEFLFLGMKRTKEDPNDPKSSAYKFNETRDQRRCL